MNHVDDLLTHGVPLNHEHDGVSNDAAHDKRVKEPVLHKFDECVSASVTSQLLLENWLCLVTHQLNGDPLLLLFGQQVVLIDLFLFLVKGLDDNTDEEVKEQKINQNFDENAEDDEKWLASFDWHHVSVCRVYLLPHGVDPSFGGLQAEECQQ